MESPAGGDAVLLNASDEPLRAPLVDALARYSDRLWVAPDDLTAFQVLHQEAPHIKVAIISVAAKAPTRAVAVGRRALDLNPNMSVIYLVEEATQSDRARFPTAIPKATAAAVLPELVGALIGPRAG